MEIKYTEISFHSYKRKVLKEAVSGSVTAGLVTCETECPCIYYRSYTKENSDLCMT